MSRTIAAAEALQAQITEALGDLVDLVTLDGIGIKPGTRAAVEIYPPKVDYTTFTARDLTFTIVAVAGPPDRPLIAWQALDAILTALEASGLNLDSAAPASYGLAGAATLPAYEITLHPLED